MDLGEVLHMTHFFNESYLMSHNKRLNSVWIMYTTSTITNFLKPNSLKYLSLDFRKKNKIGDRFPIQKKNRAFFSCVLACIRWFQSDFSKIFLNSQSGGWMSVGVNSVFWLANHTQCQLILRYFDSLEVFFACQA